MIYSVVKWTYRNVQDKNSRFNNILVRIFEGQIGRMFCDYRVMKDAKDKDRISNEAIRLYSDDSLYGYADWNLDKGGETLEKQQRGLILPYLKEKVADYPTVVEIGTGNGDVIAQLAKEYPKNNFIGVDLSVSVAQEKHKNIRNLTFMKGYALELLENKKLKGDLVFASSTFVVFTPKELENYFKEIKKAGFGAIILNEPTWGGFTGRVSKHMEQACWYHDYAYHIGNIGYETKTHSFHWKHPKSPRPDITINIVEGTRKESDTHP